MQFYGLRKHCEMCGKEIENTNERKKLYDLFYITGTYCIYCIGKIKFKSKEYGT